MYHGLTDSISSVTDLGTSDPVYTITTNDFTEQLNFLKRNDYRAVSIRQLLASNESDRPTVAITFDDGNVSDYLWALPGL